MPQVTDDPNEIKPMSYAFVKIVNLNDMDVGSIVDVIGALKQDNGTSEIISQKQGGKTLLKREITIFDESESEVRVTLWGEKANTFQAAINQIIAFKAVKIGDYQGRNLSMMSSSSMVVSPAIPEGEHLYNWVLGGGTALKSLSHSGSTGGRDAPDPLEKRKTISAISNEGLGMGEKPDYAWYKGNVTFIKHDSDNGPWYTACPNDGCNKKVIEGTDGTWHCEKCNMPVERCIRRYIISLIISDYTGHAWFSGFNDVGEIIMGCQADELHELKQDGQLQLFEDAFSKVMFKTFLFKVINNKFGLAVYILPFK